MVLEVVMRLKGVKMLDKKIGGSGNSKWKKKKLCEEMDKCIEESRKEWNIEGVLKDVKKYEEYNSMVCGW